MLPRRRRLSNERPRASRFAWAMRRSRIAPAALLSASVAAPAFAAPTFVDVTQEAGLGYVQSVAQQPPNCAFALLFCGFDAMTGGATTGDVDGDGWPDLFVTTLYAPDRLFRNRGDGTFEDFTEQAGLPLSATNSNGALFVDLDNDGDSDLYVTSHGGTRHHLYVNGGTGRFTEEAIVRGAAIADAAGPHGGTSVAAGDYDRDGWLDLLVAEWRAGIFAPGQPANVRLLRNRGAEGAAWAGHFADVTEPAGLAAAPAPSFPTPPGRYVLSPTFTDLDGDGWLDLALASDFGTSRLFWNQGDGTFVDGTEAAGVGGDQNGMGSAFGDVDSDGDLDWFVTSIFDPSPACPRLTSWRCSGNRLYRNEGARSFSDATDAFGVRDGGWGWGSAFFDADNDGDLDLVMTNGIDFEGGEPDEAFHEDPMRYWENDGAGAMTERAGEVGLTDTGSGKALLSFDYDADGDLDLFLVDTRSGGRLYRNEADNGNDWLRVRLEDPSGNPDGRGARIFVQALADGPVQVREVGTGSHFLGESETVAHFGLGAPSSEPVHLLTVQWLGGGVTGRLQVPRNQVVVVRRSAGAAGPCGLFGIELLMPISIWLARRRWRRPRERAPSAARACRGRGPSTGTRTGSSPDVRGEAPFAILFRCRPGARRIP